MDKLAILASAAALIAGLSACDRPAGDIVEADPDAVELQADAIEDALERDPATAPLPADDPVR